VFEREELLGLVALVRERGWVLISDEIHADLVFAPRRHVPLARLLPEIAEHIVTLYSPTKSFNFPGLRCGVVHFGSPALKATFARRVPDTLLGTPSVPGMEATLAAWNESQPWCDALLAYLQANRDHLVRRLQAEAPGLRLHCPEATYLAWIDCAAAVPPGQAPYDFFLRQARVGLGDGRAFGGDNAQRVRLNFATSRSILDDMIDRLVGALQP
jgi:cystathionine beta-lyase